MRKAAASTSPYGTTLIGCCIVAPMESAPVMQPPATIDGEPLDLTFVVLAYNEEGGLRPTVENCIAWMRHARRVVSILIMNDGSTDGTRAIADELARQYPNVRAH